MLPELLEEPGPGQGPLLAGHLLPKGLHQRGRSGRSRRRTAFAAHMARWWQQRANPSTSPSVAGKPSGSGPASRQASGRPRPRRSPRRGGPGSVVTGGRRGLVVRRLLRVCGGVLRSVRVVLRCGGVQRTEGRHDPATGDSYPWLAASTAMVSHYYKRVVPGALLAHMVPYLLENGGGREGEEDLLTA